MNIETLEMKVLSLEKRLDDMVMERRRETDKLQIIDIHRHQISKDVEAMVSAQEGLCNRLKVLQTITYATSGTLTTITIVLGGIAAYLKPYISITF